MAATAEEYFNNLSAFKEELLCLRRLLSTTQLQEELKWGIPTYTLKGKNILGINAFKNHFGIWFFQGVFLTDKHQKLANAQEGKTKAMRQWRFDPKDEIPEKIVLLYIIEAIENHKSGKEIKPKKAIKKKEVFIPSLLQEALDGDKNLKNAFQAFTASKHHEFAEYIKSAKQEKTKLSRLAKIKVLILKGEGLHDKYKNC